MKKLSWWFPCSQIHHRTEMRTCEENEFRQVAHLWQQCALFFFLHTTKAHTHHLMSRTFSVLRDNCSDCSSCFFFLFSCALCTQHVSPPHFFSYFLSRPDFVYYMLWFVRWGVVKCFFPNTHANPVFIKNTFFFWWFICATPTNSEQERIYRKERGAHLSSSLCLVKASFAFRRNTYWFVENDWELVLGSTISNYPPRPVTHNCTKRKKKKELGMTWLQGRPKEKTAE